MMLILSSRWRKLSLTWATLFTVYSNWEACDWPVSMSFPPSTYYKVTGAEVFEPCFYLTENDLSSWVKGSVCCKRQTVCTDENGINRYHTCCLLKTQLSNKVGMNCTSVTVRINNMQHLATVYMMFFFTTKSIISSWWFALLPMMSRFWV